MMNRRKGRYDPTARQGRQVIKEEKRVAAHVGVVLGLAQPDNNDVAGTEMDGTYCRECAQLRGAFALGDPVRKGTKRRRHDRR